MTVNLHSELVGGTYSIINAPAMTNVFRFRRVPCREKPKCSETVEIVCLACRFCSANRAILQRITIMLRKI